MPEYLKCVCIKILTMIYKIIISYFICLLGILCCISCNNSNPNPKGNPDNDLQSGEIIDFSPLGESLELVKVYSKNALLVNPYRGMQSFGFDRDGNIYYSQIAGSGKDVKGNGMGNDLLYISRGRPGENADEDFMALQYFGHGANLVVEDSKEAPYIWVSSNASKHTAGDRLESGNYWSERSVSRIKYEKGKVYEGFGGETYFLNRGDFYVQLAAIDETSQYICFVASTKDSIGLTRYFFTFRLKDVKAAPLRDFEFSVRVGGETRNKPESVIVRTVQGHDLANVQPLGAFSFRSGKNWLTDISAYPNQGIEIDKRGRIYFYEGVCANGTRPQGAYLTAFDVNGNVLGKRTAINAISDTNSLFGAGFTDKIGCMEAEGIKIIGDKLFLGFAGKLESDATGKSLKGATIFEYSLKNR